MQGGGGGGGLCKRGGGGGGAYVRGGEGGGAYLCDTTVCSILCSPNTVKIPNRGHFGDGPFVPCREVVLFLEILF